jgi:hypothetical protein
MINEFGRLNNRMMELKADMEQMKSDHEKLDDSTAELMLACGDKVMLLIGEAFVEVSEESAIECTFSSFCVDETCWPTVNICIACRLQPTTRKDSSED